MNPIDEAMSEFEKEFPRYSIHERDWIFRNLIKSYLPSMLAKYGKKAEAIGYQQGRFDGECSKEASMVNEIDAAYKEGREGGYWEGIREAGK